MTPAKAAKTYTISFPVIECRSCGTRTWKGRCVLGAVGHYCDDCAETVAIFAKMHSDRQMAAMRASGVIRIPTEPYDPKPAGIAALEAHERGPAPNLTEGEG